MDAIRVRTALFWRWLQLGATDSRRHLIRDDVLIACCIILAIAILVAAI